MDNFHSATEGELVAAAWAGNHQAFNTLAERYRAALLRVARSRLASPELAEDAVQETLLAAFRWLTTYDSRYSFRTWLWTILLNQCRRLGARQARADRRLAQLGEIAAAGEPAAQAGPAAELLARERTAWLNECLGRLPAAQADALRLRFFGGLKFQEIADAQKCSLITAKCRVRWGLEKIAAFLSSAEAGSLLANRPGES